MSAGAPARRWKPYPAYKDSGVEWLGEVPEGWEVKKLKYLSKLITKGTTPTTIGRGFVNEGITFVKVENITDNFTIDTKDCNYIDEETNNMLCRSKLKEKDILIGIAGAIGRVALVTKNILPANINQAVAIIRINTNEGKYLLYSLASENVNQYYNLSTVQSAQANLSLGDVSNIPIPLPSLPEQLTIASFLDRETAHLDTLISKKERLIALLEEKRAALISSAVTKGLNPNAPMKDSGVEWLGEVPEHWDINKFKRVAFYQEGPGLRNWQFTDNGIRVICVTNITEKGIDFSNYTKFISDDEYIQTYTHFTVERGDLLLSSSGNSWGKVAEFISDEKAILNTSTIRINENISQIIKKPFLKWILQTDNMREQLRILMTGSCQPNFGPSHLEKTIVPVPPIPEQRAIASFLDRETTKIDALIARIRGGIEKVREYRTALISAAVTGKIDVREAVG